MSEREEWVEGEEREEAHTIFLSSCSSAIQSRTSGEHEQRKNEAANRILTANTIIAHVI